MLAEALEHLVRGVVDNPDDVTVRDKRVGADRCSRSGSTPRTSAR